MGQNFPGWGSFRPSFIVIVLSGSLGACGGGDSETEPPPPEPVAENNCDFVGLNQPLTAMLGGSDPQGLPVTYSIVEDPTKGALTLSNPLTGEFTYTPDTNARGTDSFAFQVHNGQAFSNPATYRIVYTPRIMPLGDSITWGVTVTPSGQPQQPPLDQRVAYRKALRDNLTDDGYRIDFVGTLKSGWDPDFLGDDSEHEGHGGWRADELVNGKCDPDPSLTGCGNLSEWLESTRPDVVLLHAGTNDLNGTGDPVREAADVDAILRVINNWALNNWPVTVIMGRIINTSPQQLSDWNTAERRAKTTTFNDALINNVYPRHVDFTIWVDHESALDDPKYYADELHPNDDGYRKMADVWRYPLSGSGMQTGSHTGARILNKCP